MVAERETGDDRVARALAGELAMSKLTPEESVEFNSRLGAAIAQAAASTDVVSDLHARGLPAIVLNDDGDVVRIDPDGTTTPL